MSDAWRSLNITQFEQVPAGSSLTLLRITGTGPEQTTAAPADRPALLADDGHEAARFLALPSPPDDPGVLRAAYAVPQTVIRPETVFFLELADGEVIPVPAPVRRAENGPDAADDAPRQKLEQRNAELEQSLRERQAALEELEVWRGELERRLASMSTELGETTARLRTAEQEAGALRAQVAPDLNDLARRAAAAAGEVAARELAEATAEMPEPGP